MAKTFLVFILIFGGLLRIIGIGSLPPGFTPDEAAFGYNAYSLLLTGRDEWGTTWWQLPFTNLKSFGDYKLPLYAFLSVPSVKLFGLSEFAVRLPNAVLGTLSILAVYLLGSRLKGTRIGLIAAAIMAISPWGIQLSRGAFEANEITLFVPLAVYAYLSKKFTSSATLFALAVYTYHTGKIVTPLIIALLYLVVPAKKIGFYLLFGLLVIPGLISQLGLGSSRSSDLLIFNPTDNWQSVSDRRFQARMSGVPDPLARVFSNKVVYSASTWINNYLAYLSPQFLFISGQSEGTYGMLPGRGVLYKIEFIFLLAFLVSLAKSPTKNDYLLVVLILICLLPATLAKGMGLAANRTVVVLPFIMICIASGLFQIAWSKRFIGLTIAVVYLVHLTFFGYDYLVFSKRELANGMHVGKKELFERTLSVATLYNQVKISRTLGNPHIFFAFYSKYPPLAYQKAMQPYANLSKFGVSFVDQLSDYSIEKFHFGDSYADRPVMEPTLFVGKLDEFASFTTEHFHIDNPDGTTAFRVVEKTP